MKSFRKYKEKSWKHTEVFRINCLTASHKSFKGPYHPFSMFEPHIFSFHTCYVTDNHFQRIKLYFSFPDILLNLLIFLNQIFK
ncbi:hypothetical protein LDENG_00157360 [Lucifuga dentata]|nr:hypothetical protein LDENG_00157360 [Lucifuga dentata]